jgi:hypothetical protein
MQPTRSLRDDFETTDRWMERQVASSTPTGHSNCFLPRNWYAQFSWPVRFTSGEKKSECRDAFTPLPWFRPLLALRRS